MSAAPWAACVKASAALIVATSLAGCGGGTDHFFTPAPNGGGSTLGNILAFGTSDPGPAPGRAAREEPIRCPQVEVLDGTASLRSYAGTEQANNAVKYQYSMGDVARECSKSGSQILVKVGVAGRVLLGPTGQPGSFSVPIRVAVRRDSDGTPVASKLYQVPVTIAFGETQGEFSMVSEPLAVPFVQAHADDDYTILVGLDDHSAPAGAKRAPGKRRKPASG